MSAALSKALKVHNPNWLAEQLGTESYVRKIAGVLYAVIVSPGERLLAVYVVSPRRMQVRRTFTWASGVVDPHLVRAGAALVHESQQQAAPIATTESSVFKQISEACQRTYAIFEEIVVIHDAHARACAEARETLRAADAALMRSASVLIGRNRPGSFRTERGAPDAPGGRSSQSR